MTKLASNSRPPTQQRIAELAGISREAVSHILNGTTGKPYSEATRQKVREIARELNYTPHRASQTMRKGRSNLIAVIHFGSRFHTGQETVNTLPGVIRAAGYDYIINDLRWQGNSPDRVISELIHFRVEGVLLVANCASQVQAGHIERLRAVGIPIVSLFGDDGLRDIPLICGNIMASRTVLVNHLLDLGHRRLLMPTSDSRSRNTRERVESFYQAVKARGTVREITEDDFLSAENPWPDTDKVSGVVLRYNPRPRSDDGTRIHYEIAQNLMRAGRIPDALVCTNDQGAFGVFAAALENNIRIPEQMAVTGHDNEPFGTYPAFGLTTLQMDLARACEMAMGTLLSLVQGSPEPAPARQLLPAELIVRSSCGAKLKQSQIAP